MRHVSEWAQSNNLRLNTTKSVELIIHRPGVKLDELSVPPLLSASPERPTLKFWELTSLIPYPSVLTSTMWLPDALRLVMHCSFSELTDWMVQHFGTSRDQPWYPNCFTPLQCGLDFWIKRVETYARASLIDSNDESSWGRISTISSLYAKMLMIYNCSLPCYWTKTILYINCCLLWNLLNTIQYNTLYNLTQYNLIRNRPHNYIPCQL